MQDAYAALREYLGKSGGIAEVFVIAAAEVEPEGWGQIEQGRGEALRVGLGTVEEVTGNEDDGGVKAPGDIRDAPRKPALVDVPQVKVIRTTSA